MILLRLFYQFKLFSCEKDNIPVAKWQTVIVFGKVRDITLNTITMRCPRPPLQTCNRHIGFISEISSPRQHTNDHSQPGFD